MEAESYIPLKNGRVYNNYYIWTMIVRDGKVIRLKEMLDTLHVHRVFDGPEYEGETESRVNYLFDEPSIVIVGNMAPAD
jgi:hypothetical protein